MRVSSSALATDLGDWSGPGSARRRLAQRLRLLVLDGRLALATELPGERDFADALGVSRTTVAAAYAALRDSGYLSSGQRRRSQVTLPVTSPAAAAPDAGLIDLARAAPHAPGRHLRRAYDQALEQLPHHLHQSGYRPAGLMELRAAVADRYGVRGVPTRPEQILVTNGAQHALALIVHTLLRPGDRVLVEHPTYPHALATLRAAGARLVPVAMRPEGWDREALRAAAAGVRLAYLQPDHQNPTGRRMPDAERAALRLPTTLVIDETMAELALDGGAAAPMAAHQPETISVGSAAKTFWGGLRIGWIRADEALIRRLEQARARLDLGTPVVEQLACAALLHGVDAVLAQRLPALAERRTLALALLPRELPGASAWPADGGLAVWAQLPAAVSSALAGVAPEHGVQIAAGPRFGIGGAFEQQIRIPHVLEPDVLRDGLARLGGALAAVMDGHRADLVPAEVV